MGLRGNRNRLYRVAALLLACSFFLSGCTTGSRRAYSGPTVTFVDSCDRLVDIPQEITRVVPSGTLAQMVLLTMCPDMLCALSSNLSRNQKKYIASAASLAEKPVLGSLYGGKSTINVEALLSCSPEIIIDVGEEKSTIEEDMDSIQKTTGIAAVYINGNLSNLSAAYRTLGTILDREERGESLADYVDRVLSDIQRRASQIPEEQKVTVMYGCSDSGQDVKSADSIHAEIIEMVGGINVAQTYHDGGVSMEQIMLWDPDVIILSPDANYEEVFEDPQWSELTAVKERRVYEVPYAPYNWIDQPPSVQRILGIQWLGRVLYPEYFDYDMAEVTREFFSLFYGCELSREETEALMVNSLYG